MDPKELIESLDESLDDLEEVLQPLFEAPLAETMSKLDHLQQAKLAVLIPYIVQDLVYVYLKTRGVDPASHPVIPELTRIKEYFTKIKTAENPEKQRFIVDQTAADRFIKHALSDAMKAQKEAMARGEDPHAMAMKPLHPVSTRVLEVDKGITEVGVHTRFSHVGDARRLEEEEDDDDDELAVVGEGESGEATMDVEEIDVAEPEPETQSLKQKGKRKAVDVEGEVGSKTTKKRVVADPFAGYSDTEEKLSRNQKKKKKRATAATTATTDTQTPTESSSGTPMVQADSGATTPTSSPSKRTRSKKRKEKPS